MLALLQSRSGRRYIPAYAIALLYAGLGEKDNAFIWLGKVAYLRWIPSQTTSVPIQDLLVWFSVFLAFR